MADATFETGMMSSQEKKAVKRCAVNDITIVKYIFLGKSTSFMETTNQFSWVIFLFFWAKLLLGKVSISFGLTVVNHEMREPSDLISILLNFVRMNFF